MSRTPTSARTVTFVMGFAALWATVYALGARTPTGIENGPVAAVAVVIAAMLLQRHWGRSATRQSLQELGSSLGLGLPSGRALVAAIVTSTTVVTALVGYVLISGLDVGLRTNWLWLTVCLLAYHGVAEEVVWRGYAFGFLRRSLTFPKAVLASIPLLAVTHVPIYLESGPAIGTAAVIVAAVTCLPLSHLHEISGGTIWPGALLHASIDCFKVAEAPAALGFSVTIAAVATSIPFLVFGWRRALPAPLPQHRPLIASQP